MWNQVYWFLFLFAFDMIMNKLSWAIGGYTRRYIIWRGSWASVEVDWREASRSQKWRWWFEYRLDSPHLGVKVGRFVVCARFGSYSLRFICLILFLLSFEFHPNENRTQVIGKTSFLQLEYKSINYQITSGNGLKKWDFKHSLW